MTDQPVDPPVDERELADRLHGTAVAHPDEPSDEPWYEPSEDSAGPLGRVGELIRQRPMVLVAAVAAGFVLGRLVKRIARSRG
ncbi:hypothetical protein AB0I55_08700 [Actinocatenispora sera]|uniref:Uncharacterized protein n=1 Tax=Actinocatenispora sera TaxID=390989 RepID=A0A810KUV0_9ACTN|nr:hypothetical protein [Actinocatenispora sera]BCJ26091.1 hypothetical protein Asera_01990 [Actinocatenispora sera]